MRCKECGQRFATADALRKHKKLGRKKGNLGTRDFVTQKIGQAEKTGESARPEPPARIDQVPIVLMSLHLFSEFPIFQRCRIYRIPFITLGTKVSSLPKSMGSEINRFFAFLTRCYDHKGNIQIILHQ
jgi:hypothetical protein